ncbi:hypothetical protein [Robbsia andropogonis]|uniref:hypothetical protein n=1 Tax=Robbsia andropogonis TaxID=28092 RepID=UPI002A6B0A71|nr:hypothetical protein [Robbsia andropogonis]
MTTTTTTSTSTDAAGNTVTTTVTTVTTAFSPSTTASPPFSTTFTLDGSAYTGAATWNIAAQRWYLTLTDSSGNVAWAGALVGSSLDTDIDLAPGIFSSSTILFREDSGNFEVTTTTTSTS